jgi:predicted hotdog family 3-hydroxylacyl-ACP dehydratase
MKKSTVNTILLVGAAAAAWFIFTSMRRRRGSSVEAGSPIIQSEREFEADFEEVKPKQTVLDTVKNVLQTIKRSPEKKSAAQKRKTLRKDPKAAAAVKSFLNLPKIKGFDNNIGLY